MMYPRGYTSLAIEIRSTTRFTRWLDALRDVRARARVQARIERMAAGDVRSVGDQVSELRIDYGPGYRVYYTRRARAIIVLLAGGNKSTQADDIKNARRLARNL